MAFADYADDADSIKAVETPQKFEATLMSMT